jgi:hypothetical protein
MPLNSIRCDVMVALAGALCLVGCGSGTSSSSQPPLLGCSAPPPVQSAAAAPIQAFALGTKKVGTTLIFSVPAGTASISIVEQLVSAPAHAIFTDLGTLPNTAVPLTVTDASGVVVFDQFANPTDPTQAGLFFASNSPGAGTITLPNTSAALSLVAGGLPAGTWSLVVGDLAYACSLAANCAAGGGSAASTYDVTVIVKPGSGATTIPATGQVDVTFNLTPGGITPPLSAATAGSDSDLQHMVSSLAALLAPAGLQLGTVKYVDVPAASAAKIASGVDVDDVTGCGELPQLLATAPQGRQVNIFIVSNFISKDVAAGSVITGIDGTIPGPATISPGLQSGAAVSAANLRSGRPSCVPGSLALCSPNALGRVSCCGADVVSYTTAHEMGHFLGLYHVTERDGTSFDPLQDTPTCSCQSCAPDPTKCADATPPPATPHVMAVAECESPTARSASCGGGDNLMFWLFGDGSVGKLTDEQTRVMRANPAVY